MYGGIESLYVGLDAARGEEKKMSASIAGEVEKREGQAHRWAQGMTYPITGQGLITQKSPAVVPEGSPQNVLRRLGDDAASRKNTPIMTGVLDYFPLALAEVARISKAGNDQHNPGQPLHWNRGKSTDHADCIVRHLIERGTHDAEGTRHSAKVAWRALALLQTEIEEERGFKAA